VEAAAPTDSTVLLTGESGTGKELLARRLHALSGRASAAFVRVNCAAVPLEMFESEFFGHRKGAFTGASGDREGRFKLADGGTLLLDEVGAMPAAAQAKLLRVIQDGEFDRLGDEQPTRVDVRILVATNADLEAEVQQGRFRADLFFRLNVVRIRMPPLREHPEDVPLLVAHFVARFNQEMKRSVKGVAPGAMDLLQAYHWPGNVRELRNVVERAFILHSHAEEIRAEHLPAEMKRAGEERRAAAGTAPRKGDRSLPHVPEQGLVLEDVERRLIVEAMDRASGNQSKAARLLGISRDTLRYRLKKHDMA
jgi:transcriptional regulator with GAF, ATPase, and Fis domain